MSCAGFHYKKVKYRCIRNQTRKIVARAIRKDANQELNDLCQNSNSVFCFLRKMKKQGKELEGALRGRDRRLGFIEKDRAKFWKEHMEKRTNGTTWWKLM